ncbi:hypothetical protein E2562_022237 [Oryza meyeriana var. granulata]|uniref:Uncharacterized protein n=1 Tax=Oryza meyeriana var. granulata TaxID=110450 RepID=A0A6G1ENX5_9ORYZ|nr:hypothetical protein E2562_022237 [Oryza meyeriana var. granulata]
MLKETRSCQTRQVGEAQQQIHVRWDRNFTSPLLLFVRGMGQGLKGCIGRRQRRSTIMGLNMCIWKEAWSRLWTVILLKRDEEKGLSTYGGYKDSY